MNLHALVAPVIAAINPPVTISVQQSRPSVVAADGSRAPQYLAPIYVTAQVQPLSGGDLRQIEGLNLQGTMKALYLLGEVFGVSRPILKGGDLVTLPNKSVWLVAHILEPWNLTAGWTKAVIVLQNGS
jgi:hypothetical protein